MNTKDSNIEIKIKEKKVYLTNNKNDIRKNEAVDYLKNQIIKSALFAYNNEEPNQIELKKFITYVDKKIKPNKSKNDINYRIESLFNLVINLYSDYMDLIDIVTNNRQDENQK